MTPTSKPAVSPVAAQIAGRTAGEEFRPSVGQAFQPDFPFVDLPPRQAGKPDLLLTIDRFRNLLDEAGFQVLGDSETGQPDGRAWTEYGDLDQAGHRDGILLARRIPEVLAGLMERTEALLDAGWQEVRIVRTTVGSWSRVGCRRPSSPST